MIIKGWDVEGYKVAPPTERVLKVLMSPEVTDTSQLTALLSIITPGSTTGLHMHETDEFMYVVTGRGEAIIAGRKAAIEPDMLVHAPAKVMHEMKNTGAETLKLFCVYSPPLKPRLHFEKAVEAAKDSLAKSTLLR